MCGIAGIWRRDGHPLEIRDLKIMNRMQRHRGPDGSGHRCDGEIGFAHTRLILLDPSSAGDQPMANRSDTLWITFNGEVHNYLELRAQLETQDFCFRSGTDTEVVLHAFDHWRTDSFDRFNGMWALALWDRRNRRLTICRDRFGQKPLYYAFNGPRFAFASEPKAILAVFPEEADVNRSALGQFLLGSSPDGGGETVYSGIRSLPPGTFLEVTTGGQTEPQAFWKFEPGQVVRRGQPEEEFLDLLRDSVRLRLRSDFPVGICVSGGLDSSSLACLASEMCPHGPIHSFSLKYDDRPEIDESGFADLVFQTYPGFLAHWVRPPIAGLIDRLRRMVEAHDAPVNLRGRLGMWAIFEQAGRSVKTVMVGEGGDELLGGYPRFIIPYLADILKFSGLRPFLSRTELARMRNLIGGLGALGSRGLRELARALVRSRSLTALNFSSHVGRDLMESCSGLEPRSFFSTFFRDDIPRPFDSLLNNGLWNEFQFCGIPELVRSEDALGMAHSLEVRAPFLDHRLVEFCFSLPHDEKIGNGWNKYLLRRSMKGILPEGVRQRRDKKGMPSPYVDVFSDPENLRQAEELLMDGLALSQGILSRKGVTHMIRSFRSGHRVARRRLKPFWKSLSTELWLRHLKDLTQV